MKNILRFKLLLLFISCLSFRPFYGAFAQNDGRKVMAACTSPVPQVLTSSPQVTCLGNSVTLQAESNLTKFSYQWKKNGVNITTGITPNITVTESGSYTLDVKDLSCLVVTTSSPVIVNIKKLDFNPGLKVTGSTTFCPGQSVQLEVLYTCTPTSIQWKRNGVNIPSAITATYTATSAGTYTAELKGADSTASTNGTVVSTVFNASISPSGSSTICEADSVLLQGGAQNGCAVTAYQWQKNGTNIPNATSNAYYAKTAGTYTLIITAGDGVTKATSNAAVVALQAPTVQLNVSGNQNVCEGDSLNLQASSANGCTIRTYRWQKDGVDIPNATGSNYYAKTSGNYRVIISAGAGTTSVTSGTVSITVISPTPTIIASGSTTFCDGNSVTFSVNSSCNIKSYQWLKNGVEISGATGSTYSAKTSGQYTVTVIYSTLKKTSAATTVTVNSNPTAFAGDDITLTGTQKFSSSGITATGGTAPYTYQWTTTPSSVTISNPTQSNPIIGTFSQSTFIFVTVTDKNGCTGNDAAYVIYVPCTLKASIAGNDWFCSDSSTVLTGNVSGVNAPPLAYQWKQDFTTRSENGNTLKVNTTAVYRFYITDSKGCADSTNLKVTANLPVLASAGFGATLTGVEKYDLSFVNTAVGGKPDYTFNWSTTPAVKIDYPNDNRAYPVIGPFSTNTKITLKLADSRGCPATATAQITYVSCTFNAVINGAKSFCIGDTAKFSASVSNGQDPYTYSWELDSKEISKADKVSILNGGNLALTVVDKRSCVSRMSALVVQNPNPIVSISGKLNYCEGAATILTANPTNGSSPFTYNWIFENNSVGTAVTYPAGKNGFYSVAVVDAKGCKGQSSSVAIAQTASITATITALGSTSVYAPNVVTLTANQDLNLEYQWQKDAKDIAGATLASYDAKETGSYGVIVKKEGCPFPSKTIPVKVEIPTGNEPVPSGDFDISVGPNPARESILVKVALARPSTVNYRLFDLRGNPVGEWGSTGRSTDHQLSIDLNGKSSATYILQIQTETGVFVRKIIRE